MRGLALAAGTVVAAAGAEAGVRVVAKEYDEAPGVGTVFRGFSFPSIDSAGRVLVSASLPGPSVGLEPSLWEQEGGNAPELITRDFSNSGLSWDAGFPQLMDGAGGVVFRGYVRAPQTPAGGRPDGVFRAGPSGPILLATSAQGAPPLTDGRFSWTRDLRLEADGEVTVVGQWFAGGQFSAAYAAEGNTLVPFAHTAMVLDGVTNGTFLPQRARRVSESAWLVGAEFKPTGQTGVRKGVFSVSEGGVPTLVFGRGVPAPGVAGETIVDGVIVESHPTGGVAVVGSMLASAGVTVANAGGLWLWRDGAWTLVVREGDSVPGTGGVISRTFDSRVRNVAVGAGGRVLFEAWLDTAAPGIDEDNDWLLCLWENGETRVLLREGSPVPAGQGVVSEFGVAAHLDSGGNVVVNLSVAWVGEAYYVIPAQGAPRRLARTSQDVLLSLAGGEVKRDTIDRLFGNPFSAVGSGAPCPLNDEGELVVSAIVHASGDFPEDVVMVLDARPSTCPADLTGDGLVNSDDLAAMLGGWGEPVVGGVDADLNGTTVVSAADLAILLGAWGACGKSDFVSVGGK